MDVKEQTKSSSNSSVLKQFKTVLLTCLSNCGQVNWAILSIGSQERTKTSYLQRWQHEHNKK